jgi:hypothetical protein
MNKLNWLIAVAVAGAPAGAAQVQGSAQPPAAAPNASQISKEQAEKVLAQCGERRFETSAEVVVDGKPRRTGMRICAQPGDTDSDWIDRLRKAMATVETQAGLPDSARTKLLTDLRNEIARLTTVKRRALPAADALVATVPPMPAPLAATPPQNVLIGARSPYQLPTPLPLTIRCLDSGESGDGRRCDEFSRNTVLMVEADADLKSPATLRFVRKGKLRSELGVKALRRGEVARLRIPGDVCAGVVRSQLAIEIASGRGSAAPASDTLGPYELRC